MVPKVKTMPQALADRVSARTAQTCVEHPSELKSRGAVLVVNNAPFSMI
jgi:hypothetical protein